MTFPGEITDKLDPSTVMVATESFACQLPAGPNGRMQEFVVLRGKTRVAAGHPLVKANPRYFEPAEAGLTYRAEEAAVPAPGMRRPKA